MQPACTTALCRAHQSALSRCSPLLAQDGVFHEASQSLRSKLIRTLSGQHIIILGDSMARQAAHTLISRLRGDSALLDFAARNGMTYLLEVDAQQRTRDQLVILARAAQRGSSSAFAAEAASASSQQLSSVAATIRISWLPCWCLSELRQSAGATRQMIHHHDAALRSHVVIFAPNYWHITRSCSNPAPKPTVPSAEEYARTWERWMREGDSGTRSGTHSGTRYTIVNAPLENVPMRSARGNLLPDSRELNSHLSNLFRSGRFPKSFELADFHGLVRSMLPAKRAPEGPEPTMWEGKHADATSSARTGDVGPAPGWHYVCYLSNWREVLPALSSSRRWRDGGGVDPPSVRLVVAGHPSGSGCDEGGNTPLWRMLLGLKPAAAQRFMRKSTGSAFLPHALVRDGLNAWNATRAFLEALAASKGSTGSIIDVGANSGGAHQHAACPTHTSSHCMLTSFLAF